MSIEELFALFITSAGLNLIPFASPSNLLIASNAAIVTSANPFEIGLIVSFGAAAAKSVHYLITYFIGKRLGAERRQHLDRLAPRVQRWGALALFIAAATPIPDEPVVVPMGLLKYNPAKFFVAFFLGKLVITIPGAYLGKMAEDFLSPAITPEIIAVASVILTIIVTIILLRVDTIELGKRVLNKFRRENTASPQAKA